MRIILWLVSLFVPHEARQRWREEWVAELRHGGRRMASGALPDALAMRALAREARAVRRAWKPFHALDQDVRYALRSFGRGKSFALALVGSLAIGIGGTTSGFALADAAFFRPFVGVDDPDTLVQVKIGNGRIWTSTTWTEYEELKASLTSLSDLAASHEADVAVSVAGGAAENVRGAVVSGNYFNLLGVVPARGRFFLSDEDGVAWARPVAVVSHRFWERQLSSDPDVVGRNIAVNGDILTVIGVVPQGFVSVPSQHSVDVWSTFAVSNLVFQGADGQPAHVRDAGPARLDYVGRLRDAATVESAAAEAAVAGEPLIAARGRNAAARDLAVRVEPLRPDDARTYALRAAALMAVPLIVLAIACVNAANLLLARATSRSTDWLVRLALGASRWRLVRQLLVESLVLAVAGTLLGIVLSYWMLGFNAREYGFAPSLAMLINPRVFAFAAAATLATALLFGLGPAVSVTRAAVSRAPEAGRFMRGPFGSRTRSLLVVLQAALCLGLLATGAQFTNTLRKSLADDNLVDPARLLITSIDLGTLRFTDTQARGFYDELQRRLRLLPGVKFVATTEGEVHLFDAASSVRIWHPGAAGNTGQLQMGVYAGGEFFDAMRLPILRGRSFLPEEQRGAPRAVIVNQAFAKSLSQSDALGLVLRLGAASAAYPVAHDAVIVGVVPSPTYSLGHTHPIVYYPVPLEPMPAVDLLVRFDGDGPGMIAAVSGVVGSIDNRIPVKRIVTGEQLRQLRNAPDINRARAVSVLGLLGLVLAAAGLYGVVSYMVTLRRKEIGIRMALGAERASVLRLILRQSVVPVVVGCVFGAIGAASMSSVIRSRLYGVSPVDPVAFAGATLLLLAVMVLASLAPARHASRVDPVEVLRQE
jgi:putative ABC transport system permease protein